VSTLLKCFTLFWSNRDDLELASKSQLLFRNVFKDLQTLLVFIMQQMQHQGNWDKDATDMKLFTKIIESPIVLSEETLGDIESICASKVFQKELSKSKNPKNNSLFHIDFSPSTPYTVS
jgi:hypothetical protein